MLEGYGEIEKATTITKSEKAAGVKEVFIESRSYDWFVTYLVYEDRCEAIETLEGFENAKATAKNLDEAIEIASEWT